MSNSEDKRIDVEQKASLCLRLPVMRKEMTESKVIIVLTTTLLVTCASIGVSGAADQQDAVKSAVDKAIQPVMEKYEIPGMAVGITVGGKHYVLDYGVASTKTRKPVTDSTLFEIGSVSKTFTATLASWAQVSGQLSLSDKTSKYLPSLQGAKFGEVSLLNLGTHTPGGLPLQVPDNITNNDELMKYFQEWQPTYAPGTYRTYGNPGVGLLGLITAKSMNQDFTTLMEGRLFPGLSMTSTYINVPDTKMADYAQGYTEKDEPIRMATRVLSSEAGGIKTTATDMIHFVEANMGMIKLNGDLQRAITDTHTGYFKAGVMTQDLICEQYAYPVELKTLLEGNSYQMILEATPVTQMTPPMEPRKDVLINKTGSTNGFGAYVAFVPEKQMGIVILANKNYPIDDRITIAHQIFSKLGAVTPPRSGVKVRGRSGVKPYADSQPTRPRARQGGIETRQSNRSCQSNSPCRIFYRCDG
jgi:beta-lactamase class C